MVLVDMQLAFIDCLLLLMKQRFVPMFWKSVLCHSWGYVFEKWKLGLESFIFVSRNAIIYWRKFKPKSIICIFWRILYYVISSKSWDEPKLLHCIHLLPTRWVYCLFHSFGAIKLDKSFRRKIDRKIWSNFDEIRSIFIQLFGVNYPRLFPV